MMFKPTRFLSACVAAVFISTAAHAEMVDNPEYAKWSSFKPGAMARLEGTSNAGTADRKQTIVNKLVELTADKAVIETRVSMEVADKLIESPSVKLDIPAKVDSSKSNLPDGIDPKNIKGGVKTSTETIEAAGKSYKCTVTEVMIDRPDYTAVVKLWTTLEVPGGQVKIERNSQGKKSMSTTMLLAEIKIGS